jgi:hypothetical protein
MSLNTNYYYCVCKYLKDNGIIIDTSIFQSEKPYFELRDNGDGIVYISQWLVQGVSKPTNASLSAYLGNGIASYITNASINGTDIVNSTITLYITGPWSGTQTINLIYSQNKKDVKLNFLDTNILGNGSSSIISTTNTLSAISTPTITKTLSFIPTSNGSGMSGSIEINSSGYIKIYQDTDKNPFDGSSGVYGWENIDIYYSI